MVSPDRASRDVVDERVGIVEGLMRRAQWERGRTNRALAKQWGCSVDAVNDYAAEAGRRVRADVTDREEVQMTVCAALSTVVREGLRTATAAPLSVPVTCGPASSEREQRRSTSTL